MRNFINMVVLLSEAITPPTSPEFRSWFAGSVVVDDHGNPLVLYHGTKAHFDKLDARVGSSYASGHPMIFASANPDSASEFAGVMGQDDDEEASIGGNVHPIYMRLKKPLDYTKLTDPYFEWDNPTPESAMLRDKLGKTAYDNFVGTGDWSAVETNENITLLKSLGYDGFTAWEAGGVTYAAFDSSQVKSVFDFR